MAKKSNNGADKESKKARKEFDNYAEKVNQEREEKLEELKDFGEDPDKKTKIILGVVGAVVTLAVIIPLISYAIFKHNE